MQRVSLAIAVLLGLAVPARGDAPLDTFLQQRVAEELAAEGTILSRLGVTLQVDAVGDHLLVSLVDPATRRTVASTKVDHVPADREAAVALLTPVVGNLVAQLGGRPATDPAPHEAPTAGTTVAAALAEDREIKRQRDEAEAAYQHEAITFGQGVAVSSSKYGTSVVPFTIPYRDNRRLTLDEFFLAVDRPDLVKQHALRRTAGWTATIIGTIGLGVSSYLLLAKGHAPLEFDPCNFTSPDYQSCEAAYNQRQDAAESTASSYRTASIVVGGAGLIGFGIGIYYLFSQSPINDIEAQDLANAHNNKLRHKYNLPGATTGAAHVTLTPLVAANGGGLSLMGRF